MLYAYYIIYILMAMKKTLKEDWERAVGSLWPCLKGSLAKVAKPCIRPNCRRCQAGTKHPAWLLAYSQQGKRRCLYIPLALVPTIKQALKNGRRLEILLSRMGPALVKEYRQARKTSAKC